MVKAWGTVSVAASLSLFAGGAVAGAATLSGPPSAARSAVAVEGAGAQTASRVAGTRVFGPYVFTQPGSMKTGSATTYDLTLVPAGSQGMAVVKQLPGDRTQVDLYVGGLQPNRTYGAHAHANACGLTGDAAGPHYQNEKDPVTPSTDPKYANARNEIWLDFTTDGQGNGFARSVVDWKFRSGDAHSIVIHKEHTHTDPGHAGTAGPRLACIDVAF